MGCLTPHGIGLPVAAASCPVRAAPAVGRNLPLPSAGWIEPIPSPALSGLGRRVTVRLGRLDRLTRLALVAANAAVEGSPPPSDELHLAGIALGTAHGSHLANEAFQLELERGPAQEASPTLFTYTLPSSSVGEISIQLGVQGPTITLTQGVGAGLMALGLAMRIIERGEARWMLAGAADSLGPTLLAAAGGEAPLAEGAAFLCLSHQAAGALARVAGIAQGRRRDEIEALALERAGVSREALRAHLTYREDTGPAIAASHGRSGAAAPLLGACALVDARRLPALITAQDPAGTVDVVCLDLPAPSSTSEARATGVHSQRAGP